MSRAGKIARRTFLIGTAAVAGGVAFGVYAYKRTPANPLLEDLGDGQAALTPYVRVDQAGVTIITPRADFGQGAYSVQAPHMAIPQPYFGPVIPSSSRKTQRRGMSSSTSTS